MHEDFKDMRVPDTLIVSDKFWEIALDLVCLFNAGGWIPHKHPIAGMSDI